MYLLYIGSEFNYLLYSDGGRFLRSRGGERVYILNGGGRGPISSIEGRERLSSLETRDRLLPNREERLSIFSTEGGESERERKREGEREREREIEPPSLHREKRVLIFSIERPHNPYE